MNLGSGRRLDRLKVNLEQIHQPRGDAGRFELDLETSRRNFYGSQHGGPHILVVTRSGNGPRQCLIADFENISRTVISAAIDKRDFEFSGLVHARWPGDIVFSAFESADEII